MNAWRIEKDRYLASAKAGDGARLCGGRWNSPGRSVIYGSEHLALAVLEVVVHSRTPEQLQAARSRAAIEIPDEQVEVFKPGLLPAGYGPNTPTELTRAWGDAWLEQGRSPVLVVPSVIVPEERNVLFNPSHPEFKRCAWGKFRSITLDSRLWSA